MLGNWKPEFGDIVRIRKYEDVAGDNGNHIGFDKGIFIANDGIWFSEAMKKICGMEFMWEPRESPIGEIVMLKNFFITHGMVEPVCSIIEDECLTKFINGFTIK